MTAPFSFKGAGAFRNSGSPSARTDSGAAGDFPAERLVATLLADSNSLASLSEAKEASLKSELGAANFQEILSLAQEPDAALFGAGLLQVAQRLADQDKLDWALKIYGGLKQAAQDPAAAWGAAAPALHGVGRQAEAREQAILGQGAGGARFEFLLKRFAKDATDVKTILPMMAGSLVGQLAETAVLGRLAGTARSGWMVGRFAPSLVAAGAGYVPEFMTFALMNRAMAEKPEGSLLDELARSALSIGALKVMGSLGNRAFLKLHGFGEFGVPTRLIGLSEFNQFAISQSSVFAGMFLSHKLEERFGLRQKTDNATFLTDTLTSMVSMSVGGHLGHQALGSGFARFQQELRMRAGNSEALLESGGMGLSSQLAFEGPSLAKPEAAPKPLQPPAWNLMGIEEGEKVAGLQGPSPVDPPPKVQATPTSPETSPQKPPPPQFTRHLQLNEKILELMERFPRAMAQLYGSGEANAVHFGLNHLKWWMGLIQRDAGDLGVEALVQGGKILFGRWPEQEERQSEIEKALRHSLRLSGGRLSFAWEPPAAEAWWRPLWDEALESRELESPKILAGILQCVAKQRPELADEWFQALAARDIDRGVAVQELWEGPELSFAEALPEGYGHSLGYLQRAVRQKTWPEVNRLLVELHGQVWEGQDLLVWAAQLEALEVKLARVKGMQVEEERGLVRSQDPREVFDKIRSRVESGDWTPRGALALQERFGLPRSLPEDLEEFEIRLQEHLLKLDEKPYNGSPNSNEAVYYAQLSFLHQTLGDPISAREYWERAESLAENFSLPLERLKGIRLGELFIPSLDTESLAQFLANNDWDGALKTVGNIPPNLGTTVVATDLFYLAQLYRQLTMEGISGKDLTVFYPNPEQAKQDFLKVFHRRWGLDPRNTSAIALVDQFLNWAAYGAISDCLGVASQEAWGEVQQGIQLMRQIRPGPKTEQAIEGVERLRRGGKRIEDATLLEGLAIPEILLRQGDLDGAMLWASDALLGNEVEVAIHLAKVLAGLLPSFDHPNLSLSAEKTLSAKLAELEALRAGLPPQQSAHVAAFLGFYFRCLGDETRSKEAWDELDAKLALAGANLDRGVNFVIQKLAGHEWPMDPPLGQAVIEAKRRLRQGDVEGAMSLVDAAQSPEQKAHALAFLAKLLVPESALRARPPSPAIDPMLMGQLKGPMLDYAKKRGELDQGLKMQGENAGREVALEWAYLGYALNKLGAAGLARQYFDEADNAMLYAIRGQADLKAQSKAHKIIEGLMAGEEKFPAEITELIGELVEQIRGGKFAEAAEWLEQASDLTRAAGMAFFLAHTVGPDLGWNTVKLELGKTFGIGRSSGPAVPLVISDPKISRNHAQFQLVEEGGKVFLTLRDCKSTNGTSVNGDLLQGEPIRLRDGDVVSLGGVTVELKLDAGFGPGHSLSLIPESDPASPRQYTLQSVVLSPGLEKASIARVPAETSPTAALLQEVLTELNKNLAEVLQDKRADAYSISHHWRDWAMIYDALGEAWKAKCAWDQAKAWAERLQREAPGTGELEVVSEIILSFPDFEADYEGIARIFDEQADKNAKYDFEKDLQEILERARGTEEYLDGIFYDLGFVLRRARENGDLQGLKSELSDLLQRLEINRPSAEPSRKSFYDALPLRDPAAIPEAYRHLIPKPKDIVLFPRFQRILEETASLISAPDRIAVRFFGPAGTAKTTIPEMIAAKMGVPLFRIPFSRRTDPSDLEGLWSMEEVDGEYVPVFKEGAATVAMEHGFHLALDEPDLARPGVLAYLNNVSAPGEFAWVRKRNGELHRIKVHEAYRVYATENGVREIGREEHGKDFLRRFVPYYVGPWTQEEVTTVLEKLYAKAPGQRPWSRKVSEVLAYFHDKMRILAEGLEDPETKQHLPALGSGVGQQLQFTPRSVLRLAQRLAASGPLTPESVSRAIRAEYILPLADQGDRDLVWGQAEAIFAPLAEELGIAVKVPGPSLKDIDKEIYELKNKGDLLNQRIMDLRIDAPAGEERDKELKAAIVALEQINAQQFHLYKKRESLAVEDSRVSDSAWIGPARIPTLTLEGLAKKYLGGKKIPEGDFVFTDQDLRVLDELLWNRSLGIDVMLLGDAGEGKTETPGQLAKLLDLPYYPVPISSETDEEDLVGGLGRVNGKIRFIPGVVTLGTRHGGIIHPDECLLSETGKLEAVFSPLMDGAKALIVKNPYELIPRHSDTFVVLTSNPPFGDFADRHEASTAAMSRVAVIYLTGEFAKQPKDRLKILKAWMERPMPAPTGGVGTKKKILNPNSQGGGRRKLISQGLRHAHTSGTEGEGGRYQPLPVHPEVRERFQLPDSLVFDVAEGKILETKDDGSRVLPNAETDQALKKYSNYLTRRTQIEMAPLTGKVFRILYGMLGSHVTDLRGKEIQLNLVDLLARSLDAALGAGKHEWAHAAIDRPSEK